MSLSLYKSVLDFVFPKDLLRYFDLVDVQSHAISAAKRHGLESGELVFYFDELDDFRGGEEGHTYRPNGFYEASKVHDFPIMSQKVCP